MSDHIISCHVKSYHVISYHATSCHVTRRVDSIDSQSYVDPSFRVTGVVLSVCSTVLRSIYYFPRNKHLRV